MAKKEKKEKKEKKSFEPPISEMFIEITFTEPLLGTSPGDKALATEYVISQHPDGAQQDELNAQLENQGAVVTAPDSADVLQKATTVFARDERSQPVLWDYQVKGFFKDACGMLNRIAGIPDESKIKAYKKIIDGLIFVRPRQIPIRLAGDITILERPLRAQTAKGERIALARSEVAPAGSQIQLTVLLLDSTYKQYVESWLNYGRLRGLGQWRNASYGRFTWKYVH